MGDMPGTPFAERKLKSTASSHRMKNLNRGIFSKVRSKQSESAGGSVHNSNSDTKLFQDLPNLKYDSKIRDRLVNNGNTESKIRHLVRAKQHYVEHQKRIVGKQVGVTDPQLKRNIALKKMKIPNIPKNETTTKFLKNCLRKNINFAQLSEEQIKLMVQALKPKKIAANVTLLQQGDVGNSFFIVQKGKLKAFEKQSGSAEENILCEYKKGDSFGELALLYGTLREVSVETLDICWLWKLDSMSFRKVMAHGEETDYELIQQQLKLMPILAEAEVSDNTTLMEFLAQNLHLVRVRKGEVIMSKGEDGGVMYFITKGRVRCTKAGSVLMNAKSEIHHHKSIDFVTGEYFGEGALIRKYLVERDASLLRNVKDRRAYLAKNKHKYRRAANVFAVSDCEFFVLDYEAFKRLASDDVCNGRFLSTLRHNMGIRVLRTSPFVNKLRRQYREFMLENLEILEYDEGDIIIQKGEIEKILFLVIEGKVEVQNPNISPAQRYVTIGHSYGEDSFFLQKPYVHNVVALADTKLYAMTYTIFTEIFGKKMKMKDLYLSGNSEIDEKVTIDFTRLSIKAIGGNSNVSPIQQLLELNESDPRASSKIFQKVSENFEVDDDGSTVKRKVTSVRIKPEKEEQQVANQIEHQMALVRSQRQKSLRIEAKKQSFSSPVSKAEDAELLRKRYKIGGGIGMGTFGMVKLVKKRASDKKERKSYALKILNVGKIIKLGQQESVLNEKGILCQVKHPLVLKYVESYKDRENLYILTELLVGGELFEIIQKYRKKRSYMPDDHAIFYTACMVETFSYLHRQNILYRDIKPENIMIDSEGYTRLVDFGFARRCKFKTFTRCGTPEYFSPELVAQRGYNKSVDIWGIGILTYELMTGMTPFYSSNQMEMIDYILNEHPDFGDDFPDDAVDFIDRLLEKEPNERLGMSISNPNEIKEHKFLESIDWDKLYNKKLKAPWVPPHKKIKTRTEAELKLRLEEEESESAYEREVEEKDYKGWYDEF